MLYTLNTKAFFFNAKMDYLPYYKNFKLQLDANATAKNILELIKEKNENFNYPESNLVFRINNLVLDGTTLVSEIVEKLGTNLTIDPASTYRSNNGLVINDNDFMKQFEYLAPYASKEDKEYYQTLYPVHYASETSEFEREYIGDAILVMAYKMIEDGNEHKQEILNAITNPSSGLLDCEYDNNLFKENNYTEQIDELKDMAKNNNNEHPSLLDMIKERFFKKETVETSKETEASISRNQISIENIEEKSIAYYLGSTPNKIAIDFINTLTMSLVTFNRSNKSSGHTLLADNKILAYKKAGSILLGAFDAGAEVLVIEDEIDYQMFNTNFRAIEKSIGRKIIGLELITRADFQTQLKTEEV